MNLTAAVRAATVVARLVAVAVALREEGVGTVDGRRERERRESCRLRSSLVTVLEAVGNQSPNTRSFGETMLRF